MAFELVIRCCKDYAWDAVGSTMAFLRTDLHFGKETNMAGISRRTFMGTMGAGALAAPGLLRGAGSRKPNIIFFLSDDVGLELIGCYGSDRFKTPNIDALASRGIRFEIAHSAPLCGPTRCEFNTGRYAFRTGGLTNLSWTSTGGKGPKASDEFPIARTLKQAGYATCSSGKWRQIGETPGDWGYDEWLTDPTDGGWYWQKSYTKNGKLVETKEDVYCPDVCMQFTLDFFRRHREHPFYFYYPTHLIHGPILRTPDSKGDGKQDYYDDNVAYLDRILVILDRSADQCLLNHTANSGVVPWRGVPCRWRNDLVMDDLPVFDLDPVA